MIDVEKAKFDPASVFESPKQILSEKSLSREDKISILLRWADEERERLVAEEENMRRSDKDEEYILDEIQRALEHFGVYRDKGHSSDTKHG